MAAQLVGYSGWSSSNYIRENFSPDLDFGTGEWTASAWVNVPVTLPVGSFPVVGPELVTNGTFDTDTGGWSGAGGTATVENGKVKLVNDGVARFGISQSISGLAVGSTYRITFYKETSADGTEFLLSGGFSFNGWGGTYENSLQIIYLTATAATATITLNLSLWNGTGIGYFDNISVKEVSSALIAERAYSSGPKISVGVDMFGHITAVANDGVNTPRTVTTPAAYNTATWTKAEACYTTDGTLSIRVNGQQVAATYGAPLLTLNNSNAVLTIGNSYNLDAPFPGSLALLKLSATVPTAEQSQWMYEQEKQMFREGAQVTLPDSNAINDLTYDEVTDKWIAVSSTNMSEWSGLVRTNVTAVPSGSYSKLAAAGGVTLQARGSNVDITIPSYGLRKELVKRAEAAAKQARTLVPFDYVGGFTANTTNGSTSITNVAGLSYPTSYIGAQVTGAGIPAGTVVTAVSGTTAYLSKAATATGTAVQISFTDFTLPVGYEAKAVMSAGALKQEGATKDYTRLFDGFKETTRFGVAPGHTAWVQIQATRSAA